VPSKSALVTRDGHTMIVHPVMAAQLRAVTRERMDRGLDAALYRGSVP
jgi:hypothetical protein